MSENWYSVLKGALIAAVGAAVAAVADAASSGGLGAYGPLVGAVAAIVANALRLFAIKPVVAGAVGLAVGMSASPAAAQCPGGVCPVPARPVLNPAWAVPQSCPGGVCQAAPAAGCSSGCAACPAGTCGVAGACGQPGCGVAGRPVAGPVRGLIGRVFHRR